MKKIAILFSLLLITTLPALADEQAISFDELPKAAKVFITTYFKDVKIQGIYRERRASLTQYEIDMAHGIDLQFDRTGVCTEVNCKKTVVPNEIIPLKIREQLAKDFKGYKVIGYENNGRLYELKLDNGWDLTFNRSARLIDVDN